MTGNLKMASKKDPMKVGELMTRYMKLYCDRSTIHGVRYLFNDDLNSIERFCWAGIVITSLIATLGCYLIMAERYSDRLLITVVENSQYPVFHVAFPAVAVCHQRRVNWDKIQEAKAEFLPPGYSNETEAIFLDFVKRMETLRFGVFSQFSHMEDVDLEKIDYLNITRLAVLMSFKCNEIFEGECYWRKENFSCCEIFTLEKTEAGICLVFNSAITGESKKKMAADPMYPWRNSKSGEESGLKFTVKLNSTDDGIYIMTKKPTQWTDTAYSIKANMDAVVVVRPEYTTTDTNAQYIPPQHRRCIYDTETSHYLYKNIKGLKYQQRNCLNVCHEQYLMKYCNCTITMFFPWNEKSKECKPSDYRCMYKFRDVFSFDKRLFEEKYVRNIQGGMLCPCLVSCDALQYFVTVSTLPIVNRKANETPIINVDVHYQSEVTLKYRTSREFTFLEFVSSFGGIVGLFLGASIVSAIEVFYHLTFGLVIYLKTNHIFDLIWTRIQMSWRSFLKVNNTHPIALSATSTQPRPAWHKPTKRRHF